MKKGIISALLLGTALRLAVMAGAGEAVEQWSEKLAADGSLLTATLQLKLGNGQEKVEPAVEAAAQQKEAYTFVDTVLVEVPYEALPQEEAPTETTVLATTIRSDVAIQNDTSLELDLAALAAEGLSLRLPAGEPQILIIHTHGSEAYTPDAFDRYEASDTSRTQDKKYNVIRVGDALTEKLESFGLRVIHDREIYDYPSYTGSYNRSGTAVEDYLKKYPSIRIVIDLHRDAIGSGDVVYKTRAELPGKSCAQLMLVVGTGENGLSHPLWEENLKLALLMQGAMDEQYPTLARPLALKKERYNQHLTSGSLILEVGSSGNTLAEALLAIDLFGEAVGPALMELVEESL